MVLHTDYQTNFPVDRDPVPSDANLQFSCSVISVKISQQSLANNVIKILVSVH